MKQIFNLRSLCAACFALICSICGLYWNNWRYYALLVAAVAWVEVEKEWGTKEQHNKGNCQPFDEKG